MELTVSDLSVARAGAPVLSGVAFNVKAGEALVLRGPNGIGKTTLLRTLACLQSALSGHVDFPEDQGAYASHADGIKAQLTVTENLAFWADVHGTALEDQVFDAFDLVDLVDRLAGTLSAGQKRRLGLSRLLVTGRPIWVLDEPTVSLDANAVEMFAQSVRTHLTEGGSALIATHIDLGLKASLLDVAPFRAKPAALDDFDEVFL